MVEFFVIVGVVLVVSVFGVVMFVYNWKYGSQNGDVFVVVKVELVGGLQLVLFFVKVEVLVMVLFFVLIFVVVLCLVLVVLIGDNGVVVQGYFFGNGGLMQFREMFVVVGYNLKFEVCEVSEEDCSVINIFVLYWCNNCEIGWVMMI